MKMKYSSSSSSENEPSLYIYLNYPRGISFPIIDKSKLIRIGGPTSTVLFLSNRGGRRWWPISFDEHWKSMREREREAKRRKTEKPEDQQICRGLIIVFHGNFVVPRRHNTAREKSVVWKIWLIAFAGQRGWFKIRSGKDFAWIFDRPYLVTYVCECIGILSTWDEFRNSVYFVKSREVAWHSLF